MNGEAICILTFTADANGLSQQRFETCYAALLHGAPQAARSLEILRSEARLLTALDAISDVDPTGKQWPNRVPARIVRPGGQIRIAPIDRDLLRTYLLATPWAALASRAVVDVADWLTATPASD